MPSRRRVLAALSTLGIVQMGELGGAQTLPLPLLPHTVAVPEWGGTPSPKPAVAQQITRITVHHQGESWTAGADVPAYLRRLQSWSRASQGWIDIPYHYVIAPDGAVYAARPWEIPGDTQTEYDPRGHLLLMLLGNFEVQFPTEAQWQATITLIALLQQTFGLSADRLGTHRDHSLQTVCPGAHLMERWNELKLAVQARRIQR